MEENKPVETSDVKLNENSNTEVKIEGAEQVLNQEQAQPPSTQTPESPETAPIVSETSEPNKEQAQPSTTESPELTEPTTEKQSGPDKEQDKPEIKQQIQNDDESYEDVDDDYEDDVEDLKLKLDTGTEPSNPNAPQNELRDYEFEDDEEIKAEDYELNLGEEIQKLSLDEAKKSEKISKDNALKQKYSEHDNRGSDDTSTVKDDTKPTKSGSEKWTHDKYEKKKGDDSTSNKPKQQQQRQRQPQQRSNKPNERILQHLGSPSSSGNKQNESSGKLQRAQGQGHQKQNTQPKGLILSEYLEQNEQGAKKTAESGTTHKKQDTVQQLNQEKSIHKEESRPIKAVLIAVLLQLTRKSLHRPLILRNDLTTAPVSQLFLMIFTLITTDNKHNHHNSNNSNNKAFKTSLLAITIIDPIQILTLEARTTQARALTRITPQTRTMLQLNDSINRSIRTIN